MSVERAGVSVPGLAGPTDSTADFDLTGTTSVFNGDDNDVTGPGSSVMANDCVYGGTPATVTVKGRTVGRNCGVSFFSVRWDPDGPDGNDRKVTLE